MPYSCSAHRNLPTYGSWVNSLLDAENEYEYDANFMDILQKSLRIFLPDTSLLPTGEKR